MLNVAILIHRQDTFAPYLLRMVAERWRARGIVVTVSNDPATPIVADVAILHVDLTLVPDDYLVAVRNVPVVVNGHVHDISKRAVSRHLLRRGDRHDGPVIVKTDRNHSGLPEAGKRSPGTGHRVPSGRLGRAVRDRLGRLRGGAGGRRNEYVVHDSVASVPDAVWENDDLVVERFLPERRGELYCLRTWLFLGDRDRHALFLSRHPVIRSHNIEGMEPLGDIPEELRRLRRELKFDYGKFDYTMVEGQPVLFDANRTPAIGAFEQERYQAVTETLAAGITAFAGGALR